MKEQTKPNPGAPAGSKAPKYVALDFETVRIVDGKEMAATSAWHPDFRVTSMAAVFTPWTGRYRQRQCHYREGEEAIGKYLRGLMKHRVKIIVHNAMFEIKVLKARFPWFDTNLVVFDTMRAAQFLDSGLNVHQPFRLDVIRPPDLQAQLKALRDGEPYRPGTLQDPAVKGLGLEACYKRFLPLKSNTGGKTAEYTKDRFYKILRKKYGVKRGQEKRSLHLLKGDDLREYNCGDSYMTYHLFAALLKSLEMYRKDAGKYKSSQLWSYNRDDFTVDMEEHLAVCRQLASASIEGVWVDQDELRAAITQAQAEVDAIDKAFWAEVKEYAHPYRVAKVKAWVNELKTTKGRKGRLERFKKEGWKVNKGTLNFNPGSTQQLAHLFVELMGMKVKFWTTPSKGCKDPENFEPKPSMAAYHLPSYGKPGKILAERGKKMKVLKEAQKLLELVSHDGRWHFGLNPCGTASGRYSNSSDADMPKLNIQGMPRRHEGLMSCIKADEGYTFVSADLTAGEPTVTAAHAGEGNFKTINFDMAGKAPFYNEEGVLMLDDLYIAGGSVHPTDKKVVKELFNTRFKGASFADQWLDDKEVIKSEIKAKRGQWKTAMLAMQYGQGAGGMVKQAEKEGIYITLSEAKGFRSAYWNQLFPEVNDFRSVLVNRFKERGYLLNPFGFKLIPESDHKVMNYFIQSTVTSIMKYIEIEFFKKAPWCYYKATIHDEILFECPDDRLQEAKALYSQTVDELNQGLVGVKKWFAPVKTGWVEGKNFYDAK